MQHKAQLTKDHKQAKDSMARLEKKLLDTKAAVKQDLEGSFSELLLCGQSFMEALAASTHQDFGHVSTPQMLSSLFQAVLTFLKTGQQLRSHRPLDELKQAATTAHEDLLHAVRQLADSSPLARAIIYLGKVIKLAIVSFSHCLDSWPSFSAFVTSPACHKQICPRLPELRQLRTSLTHSAQKLLAMTVESSETDASAVRSVRDLLDIKNRLQTIADCLQQFGTVQSELQGVQGQILQLCITACRLIALQKHANGDFEGMLPQVCRVAPVSVFLCFISLIRSAWPQLSLPLLFEN